jgi:capsular polysaccharide transport system ATP-binding protein
VLPAGASSRPRATPERYPISFVSQGTASTQGKGRTRSQGGTFHGSLSGRENVAFIARVYGASVRHTTRYVEEFAELGGYFEMPVNTYSSGMRARLAFGACLAVQFETYLIDEVTEIGDERFRQKCAGAFRDRMQSSEIILVTHNSQTIRQYCDRGATLANGRLELFDDVDDALAHYHQLLKEPAPCASEHS